MNQRIHDDLREQISRGRVLVVAGAGVSLGASGNAPTAGWTGLLRNGIDEVLALPQRPPAGWAERMRPHLESGDIDELLFVAQEIEKRLGAPSGGDFTLWLRRAVGGLPLCDASVVEALWALGAPVATTNYDDLIEKVGGRRAISWTDEADVLRVIRGEDDGVLHLHGHWSKPESVVLGFRGYDRVLSSPLAQAVQQAIGTTRSLLFVGFGAGLSDPNFSKLLEWMAASLGAAQHWNYQLTLNGDRDAVQATHARSSRMYVIGYGDRHQDLSPFLRSLAPGGAVQPGNGGDPASAPSAGIAQQIAFGNSTVIQGDAVFGSQHNHYFAPARGREK